MGINMMKDFNFDLNEYVEYESNLFNELEETYGGDKIFDLNEILANVDTFKKMYGVTKLFSVDEFIDVDFLFESFRHVCVSIDVTIDICVLRLLLF